MEQKIVVDVNGELVASDINFAALIQRQESLEEENKHLRSRVLALEAQLEHQIPRIDDIEDKIDWSKSGKI